ncbi:MAG: hypothetical protein DKT66_21960 [Candidatus Melainabacteria bacterium]|nr:MAG: hypothetical protein DKT66_21960 [Candidatus Melainabacteria bacterium]
MPQRPTTHKDLHRAAIGLAFALVYLLEVQGAGAETTAQAASTGVAPKSQSKLVKKEPVKAAPIAASAAKSEPAKAVSVPAKHLVSPSAKPPEPEIKTPPPKAGKLREIPQSTLNEDQALSAKAEVKTAAKQAVKPDAKQAAKQDTKQVSSSESKAQTMPASKTEKKVAVVKPKKTTSSPRLNNGLVPPPPPVMPIGMDALGMYGAPVDYLSLKELEGRKKELTARFNELNSIVGDGERQIKERKEKAELFESLYQEGVVSRRELEAAKREAGEIDRDLKFKLDEFESVKISMKAVNNRLAMLKKQEEKLNPVKKKAKAVAKKK